MNSKCLRMKNASERRLAGNDVWNRGIENFSLRAMLSTGGQAGTIDIFGIRNRKNMLMRITSNLLYIILVWNSRVTGHTGNFSRNFCCYYFLEVQNSTENMFSKWATIEQHFQWVIVHTKILQFVHRLSIQNYHQNRL